MSRLDLNVKNGSELRLSAVNPGQYAAAIVRVRLKTIAALKCVAGVPGFQNHFNAEDSVNFEIVSNTESLVKLETQGSKSIGGLKPAALKAIVYNLDHTKGVPTVVKFPQKLRAVVPSSGATRIRFPRGISFPVSPEMYVVRYREVQVPDWLKKFQAYIEMFLLGNVTVEANSRWILEPTVTHMQTYNFTMHSNSRVIQQAPQLMLSVRGEMKGMP